MTPQEEAKDLIVNPLPEDAVVYSACPVSEVLKNIVYLKEMIEADQKHIAYLQKQLSILQGRIISEKIPDSDEYYIIEIPGKKMRNPIIDLKKFKCWCPAGYDLIRAQQLQDIEDRYKTDKMNLENMPIPLGLADKKIGEDKVTEYVGYQPQKVTIEVRKKQARLK